MVTPEEFVDSDSFCVSLPHADKLPAFVVEFMISMILILVCCGVWDPRNAKHHGELMELKSHATVTKVKSMHEELIVDFGILR